MNYELTPYTIHELGQRTNQEDSLFPAHGKSTPKDRLFILCDGMGGHEKGEVASATVCETMSNTILSQWNPNEPLSDNLLQQAIQDAYDALDNIHQNLGGGRERLMGTTMTFVCFHCEGATIAHIGDSRVYHIRPNHPSLGGEGGGLILFKTRDHSLVNDLIKIGEITEEEAKDHPQKNVITRAMQPCQERRAKADIAHLTDIQPGDYFYLCSDGMLEQTSDDNLLYIITKPNTSDQQKVEMLRDVTSDNKDNHTAHLIHINNVEYDPKPEPQPQGTLITPDEEEPRRRKPLLHALIVLFLLAILAAGAWLTFYLFSSEEEPEFAPTEITEDTTHQDSLLSPAENETLSEQTEDNNLTSKDSLISSITKAKTITNQ